MSDVWSPPKAEVRDVHATATAEAVDLRQRHLHHEASVRSVGSLYYLIAVMVTLGALLAVVRRPEGLLSAVAFVSVLVAIAVGVLMFMVGRGLKQLKSWTKIPAGILSALGLLGFPVGTLLNGYILYLLFSRKGAMVFSPEYQQVIAQTPDMKYRTSKFVWAFLILLFLLPVLSIVLR